MLDPIYFTLYTSTIVDICRQNDIYFGLYPVELQMYAAFIAPYILGMNKINVYVMDVQSWMTINLLKLNEEKVKIICIWTSHQLNKCLPDIEGTVEVAGENIHHSTRMTVKSISKIHHLLTADLPSVTVQSLILSKMDYCNIFLVGTTSYWLVKFQSIENMCCRLIFRIRKYQHVYT